MLIKNEKNNDMSKKPPVFTKKKKKNCSSSVTKGIAVKLLFNKEFNHPCFDIIRYRDNLSSG